MIRRPLAFLILLTALNFMNYLDRFVLSAVLKQVKSDFALSYFEAGALPAVFLISFLGTSPIFGWLGGRVPRKYLLTLGAVLWSLATIATAFASGKTALFVARAFVGIGEASFTTLAPTMIDDVAPEGRKSRWLAVLHLSAPVGSACGYILGGAIAAKHGWHASFLVAGGPGLLLGLVALLLEEPKASPSETDQREAPTTAREPFFAELKALFAIPVYRQAVFGYTAQTFGVGAFAHWAPTFLQDRHHQSEGSANLVFGALTVIAGALATLTGGFLGDRVQGKLAKSGIIDAPSRVSALLGICGIGGLLAGPLGVMAFLAPSAQLFYVFAFATEFGVFLANAPVNNAMLQAVPTRLRAAAMAVCIAMIHLFGDLWSPALIGQLIDYLGKAMIHLAMLPLPLAFLVSGVLWFRGTRYAQGASQPPT
jgi:MFS transporter, Spinster family, sphingosine-1-phosphate transporter